MGNEQSAPLEPEPAPAPRARTAGPASSAQRQVVRSTTRQPVTLSTAVDRIDAFESEDARIQQAAERLRKRRLDAFQRELRDFELKHDPFKLLGIQPTDDVAAIKHAYRRQSLRNHPDKGGDEAVFEALTKAYCYLMRRLDAMSYRASRPHEMKEQARDFAERQPGVAGESVLLDRTKFDLDRFNAVFADNRLGDPNDDGYGEMMATGSRLAEPDAPPVRRVFDREFNARVFNQTFEAEKEEDVERRVVVYDEPEPLVSSNLGFYELGGDRVEDFGRRSTTGGAAFADYKLAHTSRLIDPKSVTRAEYTDVKQLQAARSKVRYDMTPEEAERHALRATRAEAEEEERQARQRQRDRAAEEQSERVNRLLLRGSS